MPACFNSDDHNQESRGIKRIHWSYLAATPVVIRTRFMAAGRHVVTEKPMHNLQGLADFRHRGL